jgi:hypothetical protein
MQLYALQATWATHVCIIVVHSARDPPLRLLSALRQRRWRLQRLVPFEPALAEARLALLLIATEGPEVAGGAVAAFTCSPTLQQPPAYDTEAA